MAAFEISESFLLEDLNDPVAVNVMCNTDDCDLCNDIEDMEDEYEESLDDTFYGDDEYYDDDNEMVHYALDTPDDLLDNSNFDVIDCDLDEDIISDCDLSDEDGEIVDIVDGLI